MKKKLLAALLATAMTVTMFAGCGTPGSKDSKKDDSSASSERRELLTHFVKTFLLWIHRTVTLSHVQQQKSAPMRC